MGNGKASEDDVADLFGNFGEDMEEDQSLPQTPGRQKRKNEDPQNDPGKHLRPRSPTVSYQSDDQPPPSMDDHMLDSLNRRQADVGSSNDGRGHYRGILSGESGAGFAENWFGGWIVV